MININNEKKSEGVLYIYAPNIHVGGGKTLLDALLFLKLKNLKIIAVLDSRNIIKSENYNNFIYKYIKPTIYSRLSAEFWLKKVVTKKDKVLFFGNMPPLFKSKGNAILYIQNRFLIDNIYKLRYLNFMQIIRNLYERMWLILFFQNVNFILVQTKSMADTLKTSGLIGISNTQSILIEPFLPLDGFFCETDKKKNIEICYGEAYDFIYVASGNGHKNHINLIVAWCLLAAEGLFPTLCLTIDERDSPFLVDYIKDKIIKNNLKITNLGLVPQKDICEIYKISKALIYPSKFESFGLPLIEATKAGIAILASELDYVRDIVDPVETFDPDSPISISRAVRRFLGKSEGPFIVKGAKEFLNMINEF